MDRPWFRQKTYGYGAGLPLTWQGWALIGAHLASIAAVIAVFRDQIFAGITGVLVVTVPFVALARIKTEGGWRWRWGRNT